MITPEQLAAACDCTPERALRWAGPLGEAMQVFDIDTPARQAAFLAQVSHESGRLLWVRELWGPTPVQLHYEGRADLGNVRPGDGRRYLGRGPIQITGRANYRRAFEQLRELVRETPNFENWPEALEISRWGALAAGEFWHRHGLNELADADTADACRAITKRVNGGETGLADRLALWQGACRVLA